MHRIDSPGHQNNQFVNKDPVAGVPGTIAGADWLNALQEEVSGIVEAAGITLDKAANDQLLTAIGRIGLQQINDLTTLRTITPNTNRRIWLKYHDSDGDGGGGAFRAVSSAAPGTYTDDDGITIVPTGGDGSAAWIREYSGAISPMWFGAVGNGVADDTDAIQAALDALPSTGTPGGTIAFPYGRYVISRPLTVKAVGARLVGVASYYGCAIVADPSFVGTELINFTADPAYSNYGFGWAIENIEIRCSGVLANGITMHKAYDTTTIQDVNFVDVHGDHVGLQIIPNPAETNQVSQSILLSNVTGKHTGTGATAPMFYFEYCQEMTLINVKAFAGASVTELSTTYGMIFKSCRGVSMINPSVTLTSGNGMLIDSTVRRSDGIVITGITYEEIGGYAIECIGGGGNYTRHLTIVGPRPETTASDLLIADAVYFARVEAFNRAVSLGVDTHQCVINTIDIETVTDAGNQNTVMSSPNAIDKTLYIKTDANSIEYRRKDDTPIFRILSTALAYPNTGLYIRYHDSVGEQFQPVTVGTPDSGGVSKRMLVVPN